MRIPTALRRVRTVRRPKAKRSAPTTRKWVRPMCVMRVSGPSVGLQLLAGDDHGADQRGEQDEGHELEGEQPALEEGVAEGGRGLLHRPLAGGPGDLRG